MEAAASAVVPARRPWALGAVVGPRAGTWLLGFAPVLYLGLRGGGYDAVVRGEATLAIAWLLLIGALIGVLPRQRLGVAAWTAFALLGAFAVWTALATGWSGSVERTMAEVSRLGGYLALFGLAAAVLSSRAALTPTLNGLACAFGVLAGLSVLSRLHPAWFPHDDIQTFFPGSTERLNYPLNYANGLGSFIAIGVPIVFSRASQARTLLGRATAAAAAPLLVLDIVLTVSRGGILTAVVGLVVFVALIPRRLPTLATGLVAGSGSAILVAALLARSDLRNGLTTAAVGGQRREMIAYVLVVCAGVGLMQASLVLLTRAARRPGWVRVSRRTAAGALVASALIAVVIALAAGLPHRLSTEWNDFKRPEVTGSSATNLYTRLGTVSGSRRYQYWQAALSAYRSQPLRGIGPGTFESWWAQHGSVAEFIRNGHSLYLETMAELGIVGLVLIATLFVGVLGLGVWRALRAPPTGRVALATCTAGFAAFSAAAGYDWVWQIAVVPTVGLMLAAAIVAWRHPAQPSAAQAPGWGSRALLAGAAIGAVVAIVIPLSATASLRASQAAARSGDRAAALKDVNDALDVEPYAASAYVQRALIQEQAGDFRSASAEISSAIARAPGDWRLWVVRSRLDIESGRARAAVDDYRRARVLNPRSPLFAP